MLKITDIKDTDTKTLAEVKRGAEDALEGIPSGVASPGYLTGYYMGAFAREANNKECAVETMEYDLSTGELKEKRRKTKVYTSSSSSPKNSYYMSYERSKKIVEGLEEYMKLSEGMVFEAERIQAVETLKYAKDVFEELYKKQEARTRHVNSTSSRDPKEDKDKGKVNLKKMWDNAKERIMSRAEDKEPRAKSSGVGTPLGLSPARLPGAHRVDQAAYNKRVEATKKVVSRMFGSDGDDASTVVADNGPATADCTIMSYNGEDDESGDMILRCIQEDCRHHTQKALPAAQDDFVCHDCSEPVPHFLSESSLLNHIASVHLDEK